ncbi:MAG: hypothetical protein AMXMBFR13_34030 [Phycisphaerae bacterium]
MMQRPCLSLHASASGEPLPEYWPELPAPEPVRAWWIPWPVAVLIAPLLWLFPKWLGPHFTAVRWPGVILGHLFWTSYGIGCIALGEYAPRYGWVAWFTGQMPGQQDWSPWPVPTVSVIFRSPLALLGRAIIQNVEEWQVLVLGAALIVGLHLALLAAMTILIMPWITLGEPLRKLVARSVKLTLWATGSLVLFGLAWQAVALLPETVLEPLHRYEVQAFMIAAYGTWFIWMWMRSGARSPLPADGPAWTRRAPACESCGYTLTGLKPQDRCPECAAPVAESLPDCRRPTAFQSARDVARRAAGFWTTAYAVMTDRDFFRQMAIHRAHEQARWFAWLICWLEVVIVAGLAIPIVLLEPGDLTPGNLLVGLPVFGLVAGGIMVGLIGLIAHAPRRPLLHAVTVVSYWSIWLVVITIAAMLTVSVLSLMARPDWLRGHVSLGMLGRVPWAVLFDLLLCLPAMFLLLIAVWRLSRALRDTRFASA